MKKTRKTEPETEQTRPARGTAYDLTDAEKRDLIKLIELGKPLPERYRFILFEDKRAVEKGQVRFHDVAYIEVTPRYDKKDKLALAVELTDFSVFYSQGLADAIAAGMKAGKSEVVCEQGALIKLSKDKNGVITREVLTKHWTDWVDYWAIDYNYESRKEIVKVPKRMGVDGELPGVVKAGDEFIDFEERWTGAYIFENQWQSFRTRKNRELELTSAPHTYDKPGRYTIAAKVIDIFGNDTMSLVTVTVG